MQLTNRIIGLYFMLVSILVVCFAIPLFMGWIDPNPWYGVQAEQYTQDPEHWFVVNKAISVGIIAGGLTSFIFNLVLTIRANTFNKKQVIIRGLSFLVLGIALALVISKFILQLI